MLIPAADTLSCSANLIDASGLAVAQTNCDPLTDEFRFKGLADGDYYLLIAFYGSSSSILWPGVACLGDYDYANKPPCELPANSRLRIENGASIEGLEESAFVELLAEIPRVLVPEAEFGAGLPLVELLVHAGLCPSKGQARKDVEGGGVSVNNVREANFQRAVTTNDLLFGKHLLLRKGKRNYAVVTAK